MNRVVRVAGSLGDQRSQTMAPSGDKLSVVELAGDAQGKYTAQASTVVRTLALSGLAAVWLFGGGLAGKDSPPQAVVAVVLESGFLRVASVLAILALLVDVIHYLWGAFAWGRVSWALNQALLNDDYGPSPSGDVKRAWERLVRWGFANNLAYYAEIAAPEQPAGTGAGSGGLGSLVDGARQYLLSESRTDAVTEFLDRRWSPLWLNRTTNALFWCKAALAVGCYGCLLAYVL